MKKSFRDLVTALGLEARAHLALVGGGGKTSLMFSLAEELHRRKRRIILSTTTKIWHHESQRSPCTVFTEAHSSWRDHLGEGLKRDGHVFLGGRVLDSGKVKGISPALADKIYQEREIDYLIVEADGSSGHPVKAHARHEPIIPESTTMVVAMLGLEALGRTPTAGVVFRPELFVKLTGIHSQGTLSPLVLSRLFQGPGGLFKNVPRSSKKVAFLNKSDLMKRGEETEELARLILHHSSEPVDRVIIGSVLERAYYSVI